VDGRAYDHPLDPAVDASEPVAYDADLLDSDIFVSEPTLTEPIESVPADPAPLVGEEPAPAAEAGDAPLPGEAFAADGLGAEAEADAFGGLDDGEDAIGAAWSSFGSLDGVADEADGTGGGYPTPDDDDLAPAAALNAAGDADQDDRGSLLRFLSTVKP